MVEVTGMNLEQLLKEREFTDPHHNKIHLSEYPYFCIEHWIVLC